MKRIAFKMKLFPNKIEEYRKRHDEIWPELSQLLEKTGISNYSIFYDEETNLLIGVYNLSENNTIHELPHHPIMKKWWKYMSDIMETNLDHSPKSVSLDEVFHLS